MLLMMWTALLVAATAHALRVPIVGRDVYNPPITSPNADTLWRSGETATVSWDTSNLPPDSVLTNPNGKVVLGHLENGSMNLMYMNPLAEDFKLHDGQVNLTVPAVETRNDYIIVLFGDSGNSSPEFTIRGADVSSVRDEPTVISSLITLPIPITGTGIIGSSSSNSPASSYSPASSESPTSFESPASSESAVTSTLPTSSVIITVAPSSTVPPSTSIVTETPSESSSSPSESLEGVSDGVGSLRAPHTGILVWVAGLFPLLAFV